jgi:tagatose-1,6-bisphosphate aldolase non-catalytic subunit AgaZ/GatZ
MTVTHTARSEPPPALGQIVRRLTDLYQQGSHMTLLAVCPNSDAVLEAAVRVAAERRMPMLFAATLNQVDRDGGYTGWTPAAFVQRMQALGERYLSHSALYPCLDHGGPWLKDVHTRDGLSLDATMGELKQTLTACIAAGYQLLHIDPTVDRSLPVGTPISIDTVVARSVELIAHAEEERKRLGGAPISYEVGTEEVHGGLADEANFDRFLEGLRAGLAAEGLSGVWPCFVVGKVGTDLHTTFFDPAVATSLRDRVAPFGSLIKGHYTDWVANAHAYPEAGMGGANVGPEFTEVELGALLHLEEQETALRQADPDIEPSHFLSTLELAVQDSNRWQKWLLPDEQDCTTLAGLSEERRRWIVGTCARYVWQTPAVLEARSRLYRAVNGEIADPHGYVIERIMGSIAHYAQAFNLVGTLDVLNGAG